MKQFIASKPKQNKVKVYKKNQSNRKKTKETF